MVRAAGWMALPNDKLFITPLGGGDEIVGVTPIAKHPASKIERMPGRALRGPAPELFASSSLEQGRRLQPRKAESKTQQTGAFGARRDDGQDRDGAGLTGGGNLISDAAHRMVADGRPKTRQAIAKLQNRPISSV